MKIAYISPIYFSDVDLSYLSYMQAEEDISIDYFIPITKNRLKGAAINISKFYPKLNEVSLSDYKVRILDGKENRTAATTRVIIESTDGINTWSTVGVSKDIIEASFKALIDSIEYKLFKDGK